MEREDRLKRESQEREDRLRKEAQDREDRLRRETQEREDRIKREELDRLDKAKIASKVETRIDRYSQKLTNKTDADQYFTAFEKFAMMLLTSCNHEPYYNIIL